MPSQVHVRKDAVSQTQIVPLELAALPDGAARLRVESFAVTANNVTYAVIGDMFGYWNFFPAPDGSAADGWGIVPMWGHAVVEQSNCADLPVGDRVYGYLPMATHLNVLPGSVTASGFVDTAVHRQPMSPFYSQYSRLAADPEHDPANESARMIYGPLFKTGFLLESMFRREDWFGAESLIMTSASSKTSLALAHCARQSSPEVTRIGLTSAGNVTFVKATGLYDQVIAYDAVDTLDQRPSVLVDFAGNAGLVRQVHVQLGDAMRYSCLVGATHVGARDGSDEPLPGPAPILFFAPDHATATIKELGPKGFGEAVGKSWSSFVAISKGFAKVEVRTGLEAAEAAFLATLTGAADPAIGIVIEPHSC